jgi:hypothetical protein
MSGEFSVYQFFTTGKYERVREFVSVHEAIEAVWHYTHNVAAKLGVVDRVIITDGGDSICFEWRHGQGVTFPLELARDGDKP